MRSVVFFCLIIVVSVYAENGFLSALEEKLEDKFSEYAEYVANWLQSFNDERLGKSAVGRFLHYDKMKMKLEETKNQSEGRGKKKMGMAMIPVVFHMGAMSTWMLLTTILAAKSLAVGLILLVMKIAAGSAKLASFFTNLKNTRHGHDWTHQRQPHYDHHGPRDHTDLPDHGTISTYNPEWTPNDIPHFPEYKNDEVLDLNSNEFYEDFTKTNEYHVYKTIPTHDFGEGYHSDFNLDGAKKMDNKVG